MRFDTKNQNIWFTSDTHFGHKNIVLGLSEWENKTGCRDFDDFDEMNDVLIDGIINNVKPGDLLFHLGDWSFGGNEHMLIRMFRIDIRIDIHLVLGNHDKHIRNNKELIKVPPAGVPGYGIHAQDLFKSVSNYLEISVNKQLIVMSHFPMISWNKSYRKSWMLHGHAHDTLTSPAYKQWGGGDYFYESSKILDVGVDTAFRLFGEYRPFKFEEIKEIMNEKQFISIDHHDEKTDG